VLVLRATGRPGCSAATISLDAMVAQDGRWWQTGTIGRSEMRQHDDRLDGPTPLEDCSLCDGVAHFRAQSESRYLWRGRSISVFRDPDADGWGAAPRLRLASGAGSSERVPCVPGPARRQPGLRLCSRRSQGMTRRRCRRRHQIDHVIAQRDLRGSVRTPTSATAPRPTGRRRCTAPRAAPVRRCRSLAPLHAATPDGSSGGGAGVP